MAESNCKWRILLLDRLQWELINLVFLLGSILKEYIFLRYLKKYGENES